MKIAEGEIASIKPFEGWNLSQPAQSLAWWYAFDKIKHSRVENMQEASLKNTLNILAGLYMLEKKYIQKIALKENSPDVMRNDSEIFILEDWTYRFESTKDLLLEKQGNELIIDANSAVQQAQ